jgi:hypothetical protein
MGAHILLASEENFTNVLDVAYMAVLCHPENGTEQR